MIGDEEVGKKVIGDKRVGGLASYCLSAFLPT